MSFGALIRWHEGCSSDSRKRVNLDWWKGCRMPPSGSWALATLAKDMVLHCMNQRRPERSPGATDGRTIIDGVRERILAKPE